VLYTAPRRSVGGLGVLHPYRSKAVPLGRRLFSNRKEPARSQSNPVRDYESRLGDGGLKVAIACAGASVLARGHGGIMDNLVMTTQSPGPRRRVDRAVTQLLLVGHAAVVMLTLLALGGIASDQEYRESRCAYHNLDCRNPWVGVATWIAWGGSGLLLVLDFVFAISWTMKRRLAFYVPLLGCAGQVIVLVATEVVGHWSIR
jgi:Family of unknown function (DUF6264)